MSLFIFLFFYLLWRHNKDYFIIDIVNPLGYGWGLMSDLMFMPWYTSHKTRRQENVLDVREMLIWFRYQKLLLDAVLNLLRSLKT